MQVLVTGANGYLGSSIAKQLKKRGVDLIQLVRSSPTVDQVVCDLLNIQSLQKIASDYQPDVIIHCAAFVPKTLVEYSNAELASNNTVMLSNIIQCFSSRIVFVSSMTVYGESSRITRSEQDAGEPQSEYGLSKLHCEGVLCSSGRDSVAIRIPGLFGGNRDTGLVANVVKAFKSKVTPSLPTQKLLWAAMDVEDAATIISELALMEWSGFNPINVGYDDTYSINGFLELCAEEFCFSVDNEIDHPKFSFDLSKLKNLGLYPTNNLRNAIQRMAAKF